MTWFLDRIMIDMLHLTIDVLTRTRELRRIFLLCLSHFSCYPSCQFTTPNIFVFIKPLYVRSMWHNSCHFQTLNIDIAHSIYSIQLCVVGFGKKFLFSSFWRKKKFCHLYHLLLCFEGYCLCIIFASKSRREKNESDSRVFFSLLFFMWFVI